MIPKPVIRQGDPGVAEAHPTSSLKEPGWTCVHTLVLRREVELCLRTGYPGTDREWRIRCIREATLFTQGAYG